jgi:ATP-dependent protease ClpP protease subunit
MRNSKKIDLTEIFGNGIKQDDRQFHKQMVNIHEFYLSGEIGPPEEYIQWFDTIRHAGETDVIKIYINSPGGDVFTAIQFMRVLQETAANVVISVEGICASAATMIMLCGDSFEISDHSMFMCHNYSGLTFGKGGEMLDQLQHERKWSEKLLRNVYKDFLTEAEITSVLENKDIWMDGEEVVKRLRARQEKIEAEINFQQEKEETEETKADNIKKSNSKKTANRLTKKFK